MEQKKTDENDQPSTTKENNSSIKCSQCLNTLELSQNRTEQNADRLANAEKPQHSSGENSATNLNDDSQFESQLDNLMLHRCGGNRPATFIIVHRLEEMKSDRSETEHGTPVSDQNENPSNGDTQTPK